jgi:aminomethyltransferase
MPERKTVLHGLHAELGARFVPFAGFEMPVQYQEGLRAEHLHTRSAAGLFDVSHMGQVRVTGPALCETLERALPLDFDGWPIGAQRYSLLLNERGGVEDDLMVTRLADEARIVVNAAGREKDLALLRSLCPGLSFELLDRALIALQGPAAEDAFALLKPQVRSLRFMQAAAFDGWLVSRSGYTGEDGFEISLSNQEAEPLARELLKIPAVKPVGLGARDTLRLEAGLHLYGQDMDAGTTVVEANLGWAVARSRRAGGRKAGGFPGAAVYLKEAREGAKRKLVGLIGDEPVPIRHGSPILSGNAEVGVVTSGTVSPSTQRAIMLGYVGVPHLDKPLSASVRGAPRPIRITSLPFVPKRYRK